eukprot:15364859-Ditylum_brightwellii.AAC.1
MLLTWSCQKHALGQVGIFTYPMPPRPQMPPTLQTGAIHNKCSNIQNIMGFVAETELLPEDCMYAEREAVPQLMA